MTDTKISPSVHHDDELRAVCDRAAISELVNRYVVHLDQVGERPYSDSWYLSLFTDDIELEFPVGTFVGVTGLVEFHASNRAEWARTHHISANHVIELDGDRATGRAQIHSTHVHHDDHRQRLGLAEGDHYFVGGHYDLQARRTDHGWRLSRLALRVSWISGTW